MPPKKTISNASQGNIGLAGSNTTQGQKKIVVDFGA